MSDPLDVLCGGLAAPRRRPADRLTLAVGDGPADVRLRLDRVSADLQVRLDDVAADLLEVAAYVYAADQAVSRGGTREFEFGDRWKRTLRFRIPVRRPDVWDRPAVRDQLAAALEFAADDHYEFAFARHPAPADPGRYLTDAAPPPAAEFDGVVLFSGGLDSLAGAADELHALRRVALVSHNPESRVTARQRQLVAALAARAPRADLRPYHLQVEVNKGPDLNREFTQRTRSFLFAALAAAAARQLGLDRVRFYENGVTSLNLPVNGDLVGARASRTTHPQTLARFGRLFATLFDAPFRVDNPYLWRTKAEVIAALRTGGHADLIRVARSCAHTWTQTRDRPHCGRCSQCVDRRLAVLANGLRDEDDPAAGYERDAVFGELDGPDLTFAERYTALAYEMERIPDAVAFAQRFPQVNWAHPYVDLPADDAVRRLFDLHRRHADGVRTALRRVHDGHADVILGQLYPARSLLGVVLGRVPPAADPPAGGPRPGADPPGDLVIDPERFEVRCGGRACTLGNTVEFRLAGRLARSANRYVAVTTLVDEVWGDDQTSGNAVQRAVSNLRRKLRVAGLDHVHLDHQKGHYRLRAARSNAEVA